MDEKPFYATCRGREAGKPTFETAEPAKRKQQKEQTKRKTVKPAMKTAELSDSLGHIS
jgi:hypothetical protein